MSKKFYFLLLLAITTLTTLYYQISFSFLSQFYNLHHSKPPNFYVSPHTNSTGNLPEIYFKTYTQPKHFNTSCAIFPDIFEIRIKNNNWQMQTTPNGTFHLYNAYLDDRRDRVVRILGTYTQKQPQQVFFCQFWYNHSDQPMVVRSEPLFWIFHPRWGADNGQFDHPYLITCPLGELDLPMSVSLVGNECDNATNSLKVIAKKVESRKNFVVCVKGLNFPYEDMSTRLAEWIELLAILGADKINFYEFSVHPNTKKLLDYYVDKGLIEVTPISLTGDVSNQPYLQSLYLKTETTQRRLEEVIPYNDCLYKHLHEFRYVVLLDTDEVIVPTQNTWTELMDTLQETTPNMSSYVTRNIYFLDSHQHNHKWFAEVPRYMHILQHVFRAQNYTKPGFYVKGFHNTDSVIALHNHFPFACFQHCKGQEINVSLAHLQHYRSDCVKGVGDCEKMRQNSVLDMRVWHYKDELVERVGKTLRELRLLEE